MKLLIVLPISTLTDEKNKTLEKREKRVKQICEGLSKLFSFKCFSNFLLDKTNELSFVLSDNTVNNISDKILNIIPFKKYNIMLYASNLNNKYGCKNKGAGLIEHWRYMKEAIKSFDWIIHFEPRMLLKSEKFFNEFFLNNNENNFKSIFKYGSKLKNHFNTGLFSCKSYDLIKFINKYSPKYLVDNKISIEYIIYDHFKNNNNIYIIDTLDVIWYDTHKNRCVDW